MNFIKRFFGVNDRRQAQKTEQVNEYVEKQKQEYLKEMSEITKMARQVRKDTHKAYSESVELNRVVDDVVNKIAIATGGKNG